MMHRVTPECAAVVSPCSTVVSCIPVRHSIGQPWPPPAWASNAVHLSRGHRYLEINWHAKSYTWKALVANKLTGGFEFQELDMMRVSVAG